MKIEWIVKITILMALIGGCATQRQSPPSTSAAEPVAAKKQLPSVVDKVAKEAPDAAVVSRKPGSKTRQPIGAVETKNQSQVSPGIAKKPVTAEASSPKPTQRLSAATAPPPRTLPEPETSRIKPVREPVVKPRVEPKKQSAAPKVAYKSDLRPKVTVAEPAPVTKKESVPRSPKPQTHTSSNQTASRADTSKSVSSKLQPDEGKKAEKVDQKVKGRADIDSENLLAMKTWVFDEEHLPRNLPGDWVLDIRPDQLGNDRRCLLYSARKPIFDGYDNSWIRLQITTDAIVVNTDSYVDTSYPGQGLRIDNGELIPFMSSLLNKKTTYTKRSAQALMANGMTLTVSLGFWPTWPVTRTQSVSIDLTGFKSAYSVLKACSAAQ